MNREQFLRLLDAAEYLAAHIHEAPVWIVPCWKEQLRPAPRARAWHPLNQFCCSGDQSTPCFPTSPQSGIGQIVRMGSPAPIPGPYPATTQKGTLVATFCEAATHSNVIDTSTGLPGPGALILRGTQTLQPNQ